MSSAFNLASASREAFSISMTTVVFEGAFFVAFGAEGLAVAFAMEFGVWLRKGKALLARQTRFEMDNCTQPLENNDSQGYGHEK